MFFAWASIIRRYVCSQLVVQKPALLFTLRIYMVDPNDVIWKNKIQTLIDTFREAEKWFNLEYIQVYEFM